MDVTGLLSLQIMSETARLTSVVLGIADDRGPIVHPNNPKVAAFHKEGQLPTDPELKQDIDAFEAILRAEGVEVLRPKNIAERSQIFVRDVAFVIGDTWVKANMRKDSRKGDYEGVKHLENLIPANKIVYPPEHVYIEGGDVIVHAPYIFVGLSERTNEEGARFLQEQFPSMEVIAFKTISSNDPYSNVLHLDCAFQPVGERFGIIYEQGFVKRPDILYTIFGEENLFRVTGEEMFQLVPNILSISKDVIVSQTSFHRLNTWLRSKGMRVIEIGYSNVSKLGGLLRCSTLPLCRE